MRLINFLINISYFFIFENRGSIRVFLKSLICTLLIRKYDKYVFEFVDLCE